MIIMVTYILQTKGFRFTNIISNESLAVVDVWKLKDGDFSVLTNRWEDIPSTFELHPTEVEKTLVYKMMMKIEGGYEPKHIMDGPNIWRIRAGDTIVCFGKNRSDMKSEDGVLKFFKFNSDALLIGESTSIKDIKEAFLFGGLSQCCKDEIEKVRSVLGIIRKEGILRTYSTYWSLG